MAFDADRAIKRRDRLHGNKSQFLTHWQDIADIMYPQRADFVAQQTRGGRRQRKNYDSTAQQAHQMLAAAIDSFIKPKTARWFNIAAEEDAVNEDEQAKIWFRDTEDRMLRAIYNPKAKFLQQSGQTDKDLAAFGTGALFVDEASALGRLRFKSLHLRDIAITEDADYDVNTIYIDWPLTAEQAAQRFGLDKVGENVREALSLGNDNRDPDKTFKHLQVIAPTDPLEPVVPGSPMSFTSAWYEIDSKKTVGVGGFFEFPVMVPRWDTASNEVFGRSQGMIALPDAQTGNAMGKTLLIGGQKAVEPPLFVNDDAVGGSAPLTFPGGVTYFDGTALKDAGSRPFFPLDNGANIPLGREMQNDNRDLIWAAFLRNVLRLPVDAPQMTATEIIERKEEFIRTISPFLGRLESEYTGPLVERVFSIMLRADAFLPPPEILQGRNVRFEFASPIERARKQIEAAAAIATLEQLSPFLEAKPEILDNFNFDAIARDMMEINGAPNDWLLPEDVIAETREFRAQQQQIAATTALAEQAANVGATASQIPGVPEALGLPAPEAA